MESPPITEDQQSTLRRWASTAGKRPSKQDKAFLQVEKGLTSKQIDNWWKENDQVAESENTMPWAPASKTEGKAHSFQFHDFGDMETESNKYDFQCRPNNSDNVDFGYLSGDYSTFLGFASQEPVNWTLSSTQDEPSSLFLSLSNGSRQPSHSFPTMGFPSAFRRSAASSTVDTTSLMSPSSAHLNFRD